MSKYVTDVQKWIDFYVAQAAQGNTNHEDARKTYENKNEKKNVPTLWMVSPSQQTVEQAKEEMKRRKRHLKDRY